ncbi:hypothetical protein BD289DRAFT_36812 [Coniella lustricola]|uniref:Uncharacterized protein n=1 Tax=Coniella lustricola TaxID=2025994 RepID=A0A2T3AIV4_9PEZI|nr:hypothetical protein BD289DRAFT_36812 [Coniella lustricola]
MYFLLGHFRNLALLASQPATAPPGPSTLGRPLSDPARPIPACGTAAPLHLLRLQTATPAFGSCLLCFSRFLAKREKKSPRTRSFATRQPARAHRPTSALLSPPALSSL